MKIPINKKTFATLMATPIDLFFQLPRVGLTIDARLYFWGRASHTRMNPCKYDTVRANHAHRSIRCP